MSDDNLGWKKKLLMWDWHEHALKGYPGWQLDSDRHPYFHKFVVVKGKGRSSHRIASDWDDSATERFYHRDWTSSGLPFVDDGETYWTGFWFESKAERERFVKWLTETENPPRSPSGTERGGEERAVN